MSSRLLGRIAGFAILALLVACGGGDGDSGPGPNTELEPVDWSGRWEIRENSTVYESYSLACRAGESTALHTFTVSQENGIVSVGTSYGTFSGIVYEDTLEWSGTFFNQRNNRWTTFDTLRLRFVPGGQDYPDLAIGENVFEHFEDEAGPGLRLCRGWSSLSAVRTSN